MFTDEIQRITAILSYLGNPIKTLYDKITLCNLSIIETINGYIETICQIEHSGHRSFTNYFIK
ncbi:MAG: hypothetical protein IH595_00655 [Bacteroidales bacterium]|nr:hypothetical protein [Bacteroidales bacterium]